MTKREAIRQMRQSDVLQALEFTADEADALRRISLTLHRWYERECGSDSTCIVRGKLTGEDFEYDTEPNFPYLEYAGLSGRHRYQRIPDRERGAEKRLRAIIDARNARYTEFPTSDPRGPAHVPVTPISYYLQTDPRGVPLYIIRPGDVPDGADVSACYSNGICVY